MSSGRKHSTPFCRLVHWSKVGRSFSDISLSKNKVTCCVFNITFQQNLNKYLKGQPKISDVAGQEFRGGKTFVSQVNKFFLSRYPKTVFPRQCLTTPSNWPPCPPPPATLLLIIPYKLVNQSMCYSESVRRSRYRIKFMKMWKTKTFSGVQCF